MPEAELLIPMAEIAGVFVGFGALIAVRSGGPSLPQDVAPMRLVVGFGMLAVMAALAPVALARYDLAGHEVWALSSALVIGGWVVLLASTAGTREYRASWTAEIEDARAVSPRLRLWRAAQGLFWMAWTSAGLLVPIVIVLGVAPELEAELYLTAVVLTLLGAGWTLLQLVFAERRPATASPAEQAPALTGGSSA